MNYISYTIPCFFKVQDRVPKIIIRNFVYANLVLAKSELKQDIISGEMTIAEAEKYTKDLIYGSFIYAGSGDKWFKEISGKAEIKLENFQNNNDIHIDGSLDYQQNELIKDIEIFFKYNTGKGSVDILGKMNVDSEEVEVDIPGEITLTTSEYNKDLLTQIEYVEGTISKDILTGEVDISNVEFNKDILPGEIELEVTEINLSIPSSMIIQAIDKIEDIVYGNLEYAQNELSGKDRETIKGELNYEQGEINKDIINGSILVSKELVNQDIIEGNLNVDTDYEYKDIPGILEFEQSFYNKYMTGFIEEFERSKSVSDLDGEIIFTKDKLKQDIITGKIGIEKRYKEASFVCRFIIKRRPYIYGLLSRVFVPNMLNKEIYCRIDVDATRKYDMTDLPGYVILEKTGDVELGLDGRIEVQKNTNYWIDGNLTMRQVNTRHMLDSRVEVVYGTEHEIFSRVEVIRNMKIKKGYKDIVFGRVNIGSYVGKTLRCHLEVIRNEEIEEYNKDMRLPENRKLTNRRIVIVVSPWCVFNPFVFKGSLVTILDKYYRKLDLNLVYSCTPRGDFDVTNLALNYKMGLEKLHRVPIEYRKNDYINNMKSIDHFIYHMFKFNEKESPYIGRVFIFMNDPINWRNDPIAKIISVCKMNNISCVGIGGDGDYYEFLNNISNVTLNDLDWDRSDRMQRNEYIINNSSWDPRKITF